MSSADLTICSVSYRTRSLLELNWDSTARLNGSARFSWIVVENSELDAPERFGSCDSRFRIVTGASCNVDGGPRKSYHHAAGLNQVMKFVDSRFVLFIDPDCFVIARDWIETALVHMQQRRLSFFGVPYFPGERLRYRYFPCATCLFVDLERVPKSALDFTPEIEASRAAMRFDPGTLATWALTRRRDAAAVGASGVTPEVAYDALRDRLLERIIGVSRAAIGRFPDTGYRIYRKFVSSRKHRSECVVPVWRHPWHRPSRSLREAVKRWLVRWYIPDTLCPYPKRYDYTEAAGFASYGLPDLASRHWHEYIWRGRPFGFHVCGLSHGRSVVTVGQIAEILDSILSADEGIRSR